jgi:tRNA1Val (adenine37-N6)-methyltransferase
VHGISETNIGQDETLDVICDGALRFVQKRKGYRFSIDSILLANFVRLKENERMLDIGSGCGIIPVYMANKGFRNPITGVEIQKDLFRLSLKNCEMNGCSNIEFLNYDISSQWNLLENRPFHVVVSNPPYTRQETGRKSPGESRCIARHESHLTLSGLMALSSRLLRTKGRFYVIYPSKRLGEIISSARENRLEPKKLRFVYPRQQENSNLVLAEFIRDGGIGVTVEPPLYVYDEKGYNQEIKAYYSLKG